MKFVALVALMGCAGFGQVPRPAGPLMAGGVDALAGTRGRPVVLALVSTLCSHCAAEARVMQTASAEFPQVAFVAVAFNQDADPAAWAKKLGVRFPVYATDRATALKFLGIPDGLLGTPQMVYIDGAGVIRAQSERLGTPLLQSADFMRSLVKALLAARGAGRGR
jgi:thiol-disulfide isomerase/thioredoxin